MIRKGFVVNLTEYKIEYECTYDTDRVDGMWHKVWTLSGKTHQLIPIAYIFPSESELAVRDLLTQLKRAKKTYDDETSRIYYKEFPQWR